MPRRPSSRTMDTVPCTRPRKRGCGRLASSISFVLHVVLRTQVVAGRGGEIETHLIVSDGVTAKTASVNPAPNPARRLRGALTFPLIPQIVNSNEG